ncbi:hypothetical protein ARMGADRAFT_817796 [Armillaria gallica]|uniref:Uncharacterized protein n=1 Tax=Armillaria gallica TaxID=47427 RepID=A0A2H3CRC5_ARMGA|nr:hypothetical protein ARMGADRAFT_817796 [Armillaria gallica]
MEMDPMNSRAMLLFGQDDIERDGLGIVCCVCSLRDPLSSVTVASVSLNMGKCYNLIIVSLIFEPYPLHETFCHSRSIGSFLSLTVGLVGAPVSLCLCYPPLPSRVQGREPTCSIPALSFQGVFIYNKYNRIESRCRGKFVLSKGIGYIGICALRNK